MKREFLALGLLVIALPSAAAGIYRCTSPTGGVTYQETACDGATTGGLSSVPTSFPEVNTTERDRLLRQVAQLEERELRRYEIDSRERIAQADIAARERESKAALAAAQSDDSSGYAGPFYGVGGRGAHLVPIVNHRANAHHYGGGPKGGSPNH
jgi:Domain of unknown function (DUF4124)